MVEKGMTEMNKTIPTLRYLLKGFSSLAVIAFLVILANVAVTNLIFHLTDRNNAVREVVTLTLPVEVSAAVFAQITGLILFLVNFKVALANGVSRKTFLTANLLAAVLLAAVLSIYIMIILLVHRLFWPAILINHLTFPEISLAGLLLLQIGQYLVFTIAGWLIVMAYYRASLLVRWVISLAPFALLAVYLSVNARTGGAAAQFLRDFWWVSMETSPVMAVISLLAYASILYGMVYLLFRRAPLKS
jgi:hypothetical protein